jgi:O-antigen/teichoic acid export membrane protein
MKASQSIAQRSIMSVSWNVVASPANVVIGFVRSVLLARLLPVEVFGVYGWAGSVVALSAVAANFGLGGAFVHRAPETEDEEQGAAVHFTLQLIFSLVWAILLTAGTLIFASGQTRTALLVLTATSVGTHLVQTPRLILARRVVHRRLALVQVINILLSTLAAVGLAWRGVTLWALLSTDLSIFVINILFFYVWRPVWRPRLTWAPRAMRYFLRFGSRNFMAIALLRGLDRVDDLWTGA